MRKKLFHKMITVWGLVVLWAVIGLPAVMTGNPQEDTTTLQATAQVAVPLAIVSQTSLDFGSIQPSVLNPEETVEVVLNPQTGERFVRTDSGDDPNHPVLSGSNFIPTELSVSGQPSFNYSISVTNPVIVHDLSFTEQLLVVELRSFSVGSGVLSEPDFSGLGLLDSTTGTDTVFVAGTLIVPFSATNGHYRGDVDIGINYS